MFNKNEQDKRVVLIIDFNHLAYRYAFGGATQLSATIMVDGVPRALSTAALIRSSASYPSPLRQHTPP